MKPAVSAYLNKEGKVKVWPSKQEKKAVVLRYLGSLFETGRVYTEKEVNGILEQNHTFQDYFLLRRELIDKGLLCRTTNGARYWRGGLWPEEAAHDTERLALRPAAPEDRDELLKVYAGCGYMSGWTGQPHTPESLDELLAGHDLPPEGLPEFSHVAVLCKRETRETVGFAQYYTAYPRPNQFWLGLFLLHPSFQRQGYGREFIDALLEECRAQGYRRVGLGVALRNQPALKFWVGLGFDRISTVRADGEALDGGLGVLGLYRELTE